MFPIEPPQKPSKTHGKVIETKMQTELRSLSCQKIARIAKVHEKTCIKSVSIAILLLSQNTRKIYCFIIQATHLQICARKHVQKCDLTRIHITSIENTRENTCKTQFFIKPTQKLVKYSPPNPNCLRKHVQTATPCCPNSKNCEILKTFLNKSHLNRRITVKTREKC